MNNYKRKRLKPYAGFPPNRQPLDWREELIRMLIAGGINGVKQMAVVKRLSKINVDCDVVLQELEALAAQNKVQKFKPQGRKGAPPTIWRATTEILK